MAFVNPQTQQATKSSPDEGPRLGKMFVALVFFLLNFFQTATQTARMMGFIQIHEMFYELESESWDIFHLPASSENKIIYFDHAITLSEEFR